jgi:hypothetical protein
MRYLPLSSIIFVIFIQKLDRIWKSRVASIKDFSVRWNMQFLFVSLLQVAATESDFLQHFYLQL